jgi:hypothetical protein
VKTSLRLLLTALAVSGITFAAAGAPLPKYARTTAPAFALASLGLGLN